MSISAHTVAVATPCWPAPVSAMIRRLPILCASSTWPRALLSLCDPVWLRSSRLKYTGRPARSDSREARYSGCGRAGGEWGGGGAPAEIASQLIELGQVAAVIAGLRPRPLQLLERRHQRLRDELTAIGAEAMLDERAARALSHAGWPILAGSI